MVRISVGLRGPCRVGKLRTVAWRVRVLHLHGPASFLWPSGPCGLPGLVSLFHSRPFFGPGGTLGVPNELV